MNEPPPIVPTTERRVPSLPRSVWLRWSIAVVGFMVLAVAIGLGAHQTLMRSRNPQASDSSADTAQRPSQYRGTVMWRDPTGAFYRANVDPEKLDRLFAARKRALDGALLGARAFIETSVHRNIDPIFVEIQGRVPSYADWYYSYITKYLLMGHALMPALDYGARRLTGKIDPETDFVTFIEDHLAAYLEGAYAERVLYPTATTIKLEQAFNRSLSALQSEWARVAAAHGAAMQDFIVHEARRPVRVDATTAKNMPLDWDGFDEASRSHHREIYVTTTLRKGLLMPKVEMPMVNPPRRIGSETAAEAELRDDSERTDDIANVIVTLFSKLVDPVVSELGNLVTGIVAGGVAGGVASGGTGGAAAASFSVAVPLGAAVGLATTVASELISNRVESALTRSDFERRLTETLTTTQLEVDTAMITVLDRHVEAWHDATLRPALGRVMP